MSESNSSMKFTTLVLCLAVWGSVEGVCPRPDEIAPCQCRTRGTSIQVRCVNSMMGRILEAMMNIRKTVDTVDVLILENNNIPHLPSRALGSVKVKRLFLENNRIQTIDRNAFAGVERYISEIFIKEPGLKEIPEDSINFLKELTVFSIERSEITRLPKVVGLQQLKLFKVDGSNITNIQEHTLKNLPGLRYLHLTNSKLERLEAGILENLPYLLLANFTGNDISWIHPRTFLYMEQLEQVVLANNQIGDAGVVGQAVKVIKTLKVLDLSNNNIEKLRERTFVDIVSLNELNLSGNNLALIRRGAFHRLPRLLNVDLSGNELRTFDGDVFTDTQRVVDLNLSNNKFSGLDAVSLSLRSLPGLQVLDLGHNLIREIPFGALRSYPRLERLSLTQNQIRKLTQESLTGLNALTDLDLSGNQLTSSGLKGQVFDLPKLQVLDLSRNQLSEVERELLNRLSSLRRLNLASNGISSIDDNAFQPIRSLDFLNISHNSLRELSPSLLTGLNSLYELDLSHNELVTLTDHTFSDLKRLEYISLAKNELQLVSSHLFPAVNRLRYLDMSSNYLTEFPSGMLSRLRDLERLIFRKNSIQALNRDAFQGLDKLELVDLHDNRVQEIHPQAFQDLIGLKSLDLSLNVISSVGASLNPVTGLVKLNLSDNYITTLPYLAFRSLDQLTTLDISNNTIVEIGEAFVNMPRLKFLDLSFNHLPSIEAGAFKSLPKLISLHLDHNSIIRIEPNSFENLWDLERLYLSKNGISAIYMNTFRNLPSLEKLFLDDNLIKELDEKSFMNLLSLRELHLEYNLIKIINERAFNKIPSIRYLNLSYNLLQDLSRYGFYGLETLETVDLSFNDIRIVDDRAFDKLKWMVHLKLNDNNICKVTTRAFKDTNSLRRLDLNNNRIFKLQEEAFYSVKRNINHIDVSGNPLNCDCEARWLRDLVSERDYYGTQEPRCYFPKALSGNPLRQLRSSRFKCDGSLIEDACSSLPLKTPAQLHIEAVSQTGAPESLGTFNIEFGSSSTSPPSSSSSSSAAPSSTPAFVSKPLVDNEDIVDLVNNVVDGELEKTSSSDEDVAGSEDDSDYVYEYVYYYYDEEGGNGTVVDIKPASSLTKLANISLADTDLIGDTPTIYAGSSNGTEKTKEGLEEEEEPQGLSIFGIPIPSIPISLSFGLAPAISQIVSNGGLLPLGRKGEAQATGPPKPNSGESSGGISLENMKNMLSSIKDFTRGPDTELPVWVDKVKDIDFDKIAGLFPDMTVKPKRQIPKSFGSSDYGYKAPKNPMIPLSAEYQESPRSSGYFPSDSGQQGYFPNPNPDRTNQPYLKFDHPLHSGPLPGSGAATAGSIRNFAPVNRNYGTQHQQQQHQPSFKQNGFQPVFIPNNRDKSLQGFIQNRAPGGSSSQGFRGESSVTAARRPAFPGIDATIRYQDLETATPSTEDSLIDYADIYDLPQNIIYARTSPKPKLTLDVASDEFVSEESTETTTVYDPRKTAEAYGHLIPKTIDDKKQEVIDQILEKKKNSLEIYEVLTSTEPVQYETSTENEIVVDVTHKGTPKNEYEYEYDYGEEPTEQTAEESVEQPEYTYEYVYEYYYDDEDNATNSNSVDVTETTSLSTFPSLSTSSSTTSATDTTDTTSSLLSLLSFLNSERSSEPGSSTASSERRSSTVGSSLPSAYVSEGSSSSSTPWSSSTSYTPATSKEGPLLPRGGLGPPTPGPNLRMQPTDTYKEENTYSADQDNYLTNYQNNYLDQRYSELDRSSRARSSSPYPFHPDRLDPADTSSLQDGQDNSVNWYYSEYNNQNSEPYVGPGEKELNSGSVPLPSYLIYASTLLITLRAFL